MKIALIGFGKWGKVLFKNLKIITNQLTILKKKDLNNVNQKFDWAIVSTQDQYHYKIVKKYLESGINVFCEKPITRNKFQTKELYKISEKKKVNLIENQYYFYFSRKFKFYNKNQNTIFRQKKGKKIKIHEIIYRLTYHDLLLIYPYIKNKKLRKINFVEFKNNKLNFILHFDKKLLINFSYDLNKIKKKHIINKELLKTTNNILLRYIKNVFNKKINYKENKLRSLFIINMLNIIEKKLKKLV